MNPTDQEEILKFTSDFVNFFSKKMSELPNQDDIAYYKLLTSFLVAEKIILNNLKQEIFLYSNDNPEEMITTMHNEASRLASVIKNLNLKNNN